MSYALDFAGVVFLAFANLINLWWLNSGHRFAMKFGGVASLLFYS